MCSLLGPSIRNLRHLLQRRTTFCMILRQPSNIPIYFKRTFVDYNDPDPCNPKPPKPKEKEKAKEPKKKLEDTDPCGHMKEKEKQDLKKEQLKADKEKAKAEKKKKAKPKVDGLKRIKYWQARFQCADGLPVFLKLGMKDKILYYLTLALCALGLIGAFHTFLTLP